MSLAADGATVVDETSRRHVPARDLKPGMLIALAAGDRLREFTYDAHGLHVERGEAHRQRAQDARLDGFDAHLQGHVVRDGRQESLHAEIAALDAESVGILEEIRGML